MMDNLAERLGKLREARDVLGAADLPEPVWTAIAEALECSLEVVEALKTDVATVTRERDAALEQLGRIILNLPPGPRYRSPAPNHGVRLLREDFEAAEARAAAMKDDWLRWKQLYEALVKHHADGMAYAPGPTLTISAKDFAAYERIAALEAEVERLKAAPPATPSVEQFGHEIWRVLHSGNPDWPVGVNARGDHQEPFVSEVPSWKWRYGTLAERMREMALAFTKEPPQS